MKTLKLNQLENMAGGLSCIDRSNGHWNLPTCPGICVGVILSMGTAPDPGFCGF